jgi:dienelactone hydrolase
MARVAEREEAKMQPAAIGCLAMMAAFGFVCGFLRLPVLAHAAAPEAVSFPGSGPAPGVTLPAQFYHATTQGRAPALVLLHGCNGIDASEREWAEWFAGKGYDALIVDSLKPCGAGSLCEGGGSPNPHERGFDALGALAWLRTRPDVDPARIGLIGWSHGGGAAIMADARGIVAQSHVGQGFRAAVGFYPPCKSLTNLHMMTAPLLLLLGGNDQREPPHFCQELVAGLQPGGPPVTVHIYTGATHAFDDTEARGSRTINGNLVLFAYAPLSASDAHKRVLAFFSEQMR